MKIYSWNVNGIRAIAKKGFFAWMKSNQADIVCLQESKASPDQLGFELTELENFHSHFAWAERKGYSGVITYSKKEPYEVKIGLNNEKFDREGRTLITKFENFILFNIYFPNGKASSERLAYKMAYYDFLLDYLKELLKTEKNIVICGDVNTAHREIDLARPKENSQISGFLKEERAWIDKLLGIGFIDSFRALHPDLKDQYSWWSQRSGARQRNVGWRIDYFFISPNLRKKLKKAEIHQDILGSDHCPISIELS
ncbi:MAG: Exodeoxyribonuclease III [Candidatus Pacebacteria bacterium GW2011_GWF2_38_9]|nr:MAG: exodeoxyribonuclease III [candidate division TM6 bacterium GW2011_GWF2_28_16]KKQ10235.1 MAG: Exodeoxyribonuclease III [Candidatus Pacebacteria bacterium GW2011_GWF1_36_5]KKQ88805.1 MAG: Exodeoxyribonuclease III [Candidatus Pacebacteria bacterium GW2011_GWF2_38_9]HAZ73255.1 exodeoxyribonuclease III [Candidatus Paceibacterota bacterium]